MKDKENAKVSADLVVTDSVDGTTGGKGNNVRYLKTYGVRGLMEWQITLPTGREVKPFVTITFEGGQITGFGVLPATFTTDDSVLQKIIENSVYRREGRIEVLHEIPLNKVRRQRKESEF